VRRVTLDVYKIKNYFQEKMYYYLMQREHSKSALSKSCDETCLSQEKVGRVLDEFTMSGNEENGEKNKRKTRFAPSATEILALSTKFFTSQYLFKVIFFSGTIQGFKPHTFFELFVGWLKVLSIFCPFPF